MRAVVIAAAFAGAQAFMSMDPDDRHYGPCQTAQDCGDDMFCASWCETGSCSSFNDEVEGVCQPCCGVCTEEEIVFGSEDCASVCGGFYVSHQECPGIAPYDTDPEKTTRERCPNYDAYMVQEETGPHPHWDDVPNHFENFCTSDIGPDALDVPRANPDCFDWAMQRVESFDDYGEPEVWGEEAMKYCQGRFMCPNITKVQVYNADKALYGMAACEEMVNFQDCAYFDEMDYCNMVFSCPESWWLGDHEYFDMALNTFACEEMTEAGSHCNIAWTIFDEGAITSCEAFLAGTPMA